jgi:2-isopropylmalate synthase
MGLDDAALEEVVMALKTRGDFFAASTGVNAKELAATSGLLARTVEIPVAPNKAVVGANAFAHASGIHQDGMLKNARTYEIMRPEDVGFEESVLPLTARSGRAALEYRLRRLGRIPSAEEMPELFRRFKSFADTRRFVSDEDLRSLAGLSAEAEL